MKRAFGNILFLEDQHKQLRKMRRGSASKSSMFKIQNEKNHYKNFLQNVEHCRTVRLYPNLLESIKRCSSTIYEMCYDFSEESSFVKGLNYGCRNFGFSMPHSTIIIYRDWFPHAKKVVLTMITDSHSTVYEMKKMEDELNMWQTQVDIEQNQVSDDTKMFVEITSKNDQVYRMPPPSSKIQCGQYGYLRLDPDIPFLKHPKKQEIIQAYTLDLAKISFDQVFTFLEEKQQILQKFNTLIIRNLFKSEYLLNRHTLKYEDFEKLRDLISKCKNDFGLRAILEWNFEAGKRKYQSNPYQQSLFVEKEPGIWQYKLDDKEVASFYLSNLSYYLRIFKFDGFHFKRIEEFANNENGQILIKCMNLMSRRINENGFTLASSRVEIPGLDQPILEGGLGFTFSYTWEQNLMECNSAIELKKKFDKILSSSNCVPVNLDMLNKEHELNFLFAVFTSGRGVFCKGSLNKNKEFIEKVLRTRNQSEIFESDIEFKLVEQDLILVKRERAWILFNFSHKSTVIELENANNMEMISYFSDEEPVCTEKGVELKEKSCCILEQ